MKPLMLAGVILTALGIIALVFASGIHYTGRESLPRDGETQAVAKHDQIISIPPVLGGLAVAGGFALMLIAARK